MNAETRIDKSTLDPEGMLKVLDLVRVLARPFDLGDVLTLVIDAGRSVLGADRGSIFLYDSGTQELYSTVATGDHEIRFSISSGLAGECARTRAVVNVNDCYADARFNSAFDVLQFSF
jgi:phosphoserine phosphatase